jgi:hypothetical protein
MMDTGIGQSVTMVHGIIFHTQEFLLFLNKLIITGIMIESDIFLMDNSRNIGESGIGVTTGMKGTGKERYIGNKIQYTSVSQKTGMRLGFLSKITGNFNETEVESA